MKAVHVHEFGPPEVMRFEELDDPEPGPEQVLVKVHAAGVNPVDVYFRAGWYPSAKKLPYIPGMDAAGVIEAAGAEVRKVAPGERVYVAGSLTGCYAEKTLCEEFQVYHLPDHLSFEEGAGVNVPYSAAYHALFNRARARKGEVVLIHGADGAVGIASTQLAHTLGMRIIGTSGSDRGRQLAKGQGVESVFDHHSSEHFQEIMKATDGHGVDVILEMLANANLGKDLGILADNGRVVIIGSRGTVEIDPRDAMGRNATILGMSLLRLPEEQLAAIHEALGVGLRDGTLSPVIGRKFPLEEAARAHHEIMETPSYGKILLMP